MLLEQVKFVDEIPKQGATANTQAKHNRLAEILKSRPGKWARVGKCEKTTSLQGAITTATVPAYEPRGSFEAATRSVERDGEKGYDIWARYLGSGNE